MSILNWLIRSSNWDVKTKNSTGIERVSFTPDGIVFHIGNASFPIAWNEIVSIDAFKIDNFTIDTICLDIQATNSREFVITEDVAEYKELTKLLPDVLPGLDRGWFLKVYLPPFEECRTLIFTRQ